MKKCKGLLLLLCALLLTSCGWGGSKKVVEESDDRRAADSGGTLTVPLTNFDTLNPLLTQNRSYFQLSHLLFDRLFEYEGSGRLVPSIAEHVETSDEGRRVSVTLRKGIFWQDGTPVTTKDVAATFNAVKHAPSESPYQQIFRHTPGIGAGTNLDTVAKAVIFDDRNIDFEFNRAYGNYLELLSFPILPAHIYSEEAMLDGENFEVAGSGPFLLKKWEKNKKIYLEKNPNYYGNLPYVDGIVGLIFPDQNAIQQAYDAGQIDLFVVDDYTWDRYKSDEKSTVEPYETQRVEVVSMNTQDPYLSDVNLRRALDLAINKERMIDSLYLSQGTMANFFINPKLSAGTFTKEESYMSVDGAMNVLDKAGYRDVDGDGFREGKNGEALNLAILTNGENHRMKTEAQLVSEDLKKIGIRSHLVTAGDGAEGQKGGGDETKQKQSADNFARALQGGAYQMAVVGMDFSAVVNLSSVLSSDGIGGMNISRYSNPEMDECLKQLARAQGEKDRKAYIDKAYKLFRDDVPYIPMVFKQNVLVTGPRVAGRMRPDAFFVYKGIDDVSIKENRQEKTIQKK
ncbi:MAG: peptide ABC transporter substrate-binding protein [Peptoniphilus sp.]|nr:peptide ABC transporter substrate-binding protein [Peptoniphilus sp.]MDY3118918.1 peptide ABC transporter substrate-binding protein [Peptoniphilus sp.]